MARESLEETQARLWLNYATEYNTRVFQKIASRYASLTEAKIAFEDGAKWGDALPEYFRTRLQEAARPGFLERFVEQMDKKNIRFTYPGEER